MNEQRSLCVDEQRGAKCKHRMFPRCPGCRVEMYGPAVWDFSHGQVSCGCGYRVTPEVYVR